MSSRLFLIPSAEISFHSPKTLTSHIHTLFLSPSSLQSLSSHETEPSSYSFTQRQNFAPLVSGYPSMYLSFACTNYVLLLTNPLLSCAFFIFLKCSKYFFYRQLFRWFFFSFLFEENDSILDFVSSLLAANSKPIPKVRKHAHIRIHKVDSFMHNTTTGQPDIPFLLYYFFPVLLVSGYILSYFICLIPLTSYAMFCIYYHLVLWWCVSSGEDTITDRLLFIYLFFHSSFVDDIVDIAAAFWCNGVLCQLHLIVSWKSALPAIGQNA